MSSSDSQNTGWGSGSGQGGGAGGSIRDLGTAYRKRQERLEEPYFRRLTEHQLDTLKKSLNEEIKYHLDEILDHEKAIQRHREKLEKLKTMQDE